MPCRPSLAESAIPNLALSWAMTWAIRQTPVLFPRSRDFQCSVSSFFYQAHSRWVFALFPSGIGASPLFSLCILLPNEKCDIIESCVGTWRVPSIANASSFTYFAKSESSSTHKHDARWFTLRLHCHWALHVDLVYSGTTLPFLRKVDRYVKTWVRTIR